VNDAGFLRHALLDALGIRHGFGTRAAAEPAGLVRPEQVHGRAVARLERAGAHRVGRADAIVSTCPGVPIGVVSADCVPVLIATPTGVAAAAHAGWRGLAAGVLPAVLEAVRELAPDAAEAVAVIGPHVGAGCYEVDAPVVDALAARFGARLDAAIRPTRPGHWELALGALARAELAAHGIREERIGTLAGACTACDAERFHSYRRDGPGAGRLVHFAVAGPGGRVPT
jgi:purine-nucleoside/S-methyl-5'-thioadenosine phosphorylase / adenosine deaminase